MSCHRTLFVRPSKDFGAHISMSVLLLQARRLVRIVCVRLMTPSCPSPLLLEMNIVQPGPRLRQHDLLQPEEAEAMAMAMVRVYEDAAVSLAAMPVIAGRKSRLESFAGADTTYTIEAMMGDCRALQARQSSTLCEVSRRCDYLATMPTLTMTKATRLDLNMLDTLPSAASGVALALMRALQQTATRCAGGDEP